MYEGEHGRQDAYTRRERARAGEREAGRSHTRLLNSKSPTHPASLNRRGFLLLAAAPPTTPKFHLLPIVNSAWI